MARRNDHTREELKELILLSAWQIVGADGFEGLTARRLATEIGYAPGTIYNLFKSMDDLYLAVNSLTLERLLVVLASTACNDPKKSPLENMKKMAALYMKFAREYRPYWLMLFSHRLPEGRKVQGWYQQKIDQLFGPLEELMRPLFKTGQEKKRKTAARVLWASVHGLCFLQETGKIHVVTGKLSTGSPEMSGYLIDTFIAGLKSS